MLSKIKGWQISLSITMLFFGIILTMQFNTQQDVLSNLENQKENDLVAIVKNLNDKRSSLVTELQELEKLKSSVVEKAQTGDNLQSSLDADLKRLEIATGVTPLEGPGIVVSITTSDASIMYLDLVDIINELWTTGAEAVAVNDIRITANTSIQDIQDGNKTSIAINGTKLLSPIIIKAVGDAKTLETGLTFSGGIVDNLSTLYNIHPDIRKEAKIIIPAAVNR